MQQEFNPYRPPEAPVVDRGTGEDADGVAVWRDGNAVVAVRDRAFPPRCVKCNAPVQKQAMHARRFYWHTPWLYLLILLNILIYALVAMGVRKKTLHDVALCARHLRRRRIFIAIGWSWPLAIFIAAAFSQDIGIMIGVLLAVALIFVGIFGSRVMVAGRIDDRHARFTGCGKAFVDSLPVLPARLRY